MYTVFVLADTYHAYIKNSLIPKCWIKVSFCVAVHFISELLNICTHAAAAKSLQSCLTLCDPIDDSPPGSPVPGILQARTLEWVAILLQCMKVKSESEVAQSCQTLSNPMDHSLPGSSIHGIFQARTLEWGAIAFSDMYTYLYANMFAYGFSISLWKKDT